MPISWENLILGAGATVFLGACLLFLTSIYFKQRWRILDLLMILIGGTLPMNLVLSTRSPSSWEVHEVVSAIMIGVGGVIATAFGSAMSMRFIESFRIENAILRVAFLLMGWLALLSIPATIFSLIAFAFIIFDRQRELIGAATFAASTSVVWIPWMLFERRRKQIPIR